MDTLIHSARLGPSAGAAHSPGEVLGRLIESGGARIGVIGLGYVGLPLVPAIASAGYRVLGFDRDDGKITLLERGRSYIRHIPNDAIAALVGNGSFEATTDMSRLAEADVVIICVPTPLTPNREPDLSHVIATAETIAHHLRRGQLVILESTTYPGTTCDVLRPILERSGLRSGADFFLAYSPEREDPGNPQYKTAQIPKVIGGDGATATDLANRLYSRFVVSTVPVSSTAAAEAVKLTENIFRSVNIALVNELKVIYDAMGIDIWEIIEAAKTKPFGFMAFYPGPGLGGHCLPVDPFYLTWKAREYHVSTRFIELAGEINAGMPAHVVGRVAMAIDREHGKGLTGARILLLGVAYKRDIEDIRESPALRIIQLLEQRGAKVDYHDPHVARLPRTRHYPELSERGSVPLHRRSLAGYDAVLLCTDHRSVDYDLVLESARLIVDTRNVFGTRARGSGRVVKA
jgi:UDP-N-acetyl-D-glucosamine dehydrogenase